MVLLLAQAQDPSVGIVRDAPDAVLGWIKGQLTDGGLMIYLQQCTLELVVPHPDTTLLITGNNDTMTTRDGSDISIGM
jgi:hypothetical protein